MILELYITGGGRIRFPIGHSDAIPVPTLIPGEYSENAIVMAHLSGFESQPSRSDYRLQLAYNPFCKFKFLRERTIDGQQCYEMYYEKKEKDAKGQWIRTPEPQGKLLYGAMGPSVLRLMERRRNSKGKVDYVDIWRAEVIVRPNDDRLAVMRKMVSEIFPVNPYLAMSHAWGLSKVPVRKEWKGESSSLGIWSALIEYEATKFVFKKIAPHLQSMIMSSASKIEKRNAIVGMRFIRRLSPQVVRRISRQIATMGERAIDCHVCTSAYADSNDMIAHRVIGDFLRRLLTRLTKIQDEYQRFVRAGKAEYDNLLSGGDKKDYHRRAVSEEYATIREIQELKKSIGAIYVSGPWKDLPIGPSILLLDADAFQYGPHYRYVYSQLSAFARMEFIWSRNWDNNENAQNQRNTLSHELGSSAENPNVWIHNYTVIYEGWVLVRLLRAFERLGFGMLKQYQSWVVKNAIDAYMAQRHNTEFELSSLDSNIKIELCSVCSFPPRDPEQKGFCHQQDGTKNSLTPDFSMRISKKDACDESYALVLDAKSGRELQIEDILARMKYQENVRKNADDTLDQVWLIYAGDSHVENKPTAGIEFSHLDGKECWNDRDDEYGGWREKGRKESPLTVNGTFKWGRSGISKDGQMKKFSRKDTFVGHLRANAVTAEGSDVFEEFVEGIVNTARHVLKAVVP